LPAAPSGSAAAPESSRLSAGGTEQPAGDARRRRHEARPQQPRVIGCEAALVLGEAQGEEAARIEIDADRRAAVTVKLSPSTALAMRARLAICTASAAMRCAAKAGRRGNASLACV
jgi:hypothetical protein